MPYLAAVSFIWAFSFGLIGSRLSGVDPYFVASVRLGLATLLLLPFFRWQRLRTGDLWRLPLYGAVQFGLMYVAYIKAFQYLPSHLVALFSVLTPVYVVLIHDLRCGVFTPRYLGAALLSVIGAAAIRAKGGESDALWIGFGLMQLAGLGFAFGQVAYRDWKRQRPELPDRECFALLYAGGLLFALFSSLLLGDWTALEVSATQWQALLYLGLVASGTGFFLWNKGAARVTPGVLAAFNNVVVPLAVLCSLFIFREAADFTAVDALRLVLGAGLIGAALWLGQRK
ncbi:MAG: EamA family transporter [Opitutales bacterium]